MNPRLRLLAGVCLVLLLGIGLGRAGDILRGGAATSSAKRNATSGSRGNEAAAAQANANAKDRLARTTKAIQSVRNMQQKAAAVRTVPNGLQEGGLKVLTGPNARWEGAAAPVQSGGEVKIVQSQSQALLHWETFNVGRETTVNFDQSAGKADAGKWIAFNKIFDPSGKPSQILGSIRADGQVYLINQNGVIFGAGSQVNTRTLVVSSLPINDNLVQQGLLNNPDSQFLFTTTSIPGGSDGTPVFHPRMADAPFALLGGATSYTTAETVAVDGGGLLLAPPIIRSGGQGTPILALVPDVDYTISVDSVTRKATVNFTAAGLGKIGSTPVSVSYTPAVMRAGPVTVEAGARIQTPVSGDGNGGRVVLVAPNVVNDGYISTPAGQTILAAGHQVGFASHASSDPSLRGLDAWVGAVRDAGTVTNTGLVEALIGSIQFVGKRIEQKGILESSTSVNLNGRIDLRASYDAVSYPFFEKGGPQFFFQSTGVLDLGADSVMRVLPDYLSGSSVPGLSLPERSQINLEGKAIRFGQGSILLAPNAEVNIRAGEWPSTAIAYDSAQNAFRNGFYDGNQQRFLFSGGQIFLEKSALISVAGSTDVFVPLAQNIVDVSLRGPELADSPLQRGGILRAVPLRVDLRQSGSLDGRYWIGTPLGDATGVAALISRNAAQLTAAGGEVNLSAGESIVVQKGSLIDVSGGYFQHEGGMVNTSRLTRQGHIVDIKDAMPNLIYDDIYTGKSSKTSAKWGQTKVYALPLANNGDRYQQSYVEGAGGGSVKLNAPSMAIDGELVGNVVQGPPGRSALPGLSSLSIAFEGETLYKGASSADAKFLVYSPTPPVVVFTPEKSNASVPVFQLTGDVPAALPADRLTTVNLSPTLLAENGFGKVTVRNTEGDILVPEDTDLVAPAGGSISLIAANVRIDGQVRVPGGSIGLIAYNISPFETDKFPLNTVASVVDLIPLPNAGRGLIELGEGGVLSTAGLMVDEEEDGFAENTMLEGGQISLESYSANLAPGGLIDVSGGVRVSAKGRISYGNGGSLAILTGRDPKFGTDGSGFGSVLGGELLMGSTLQGYSGVKGGSLSLRASLIQVGGAAPADVLALDPGFFRSGGFTSYSLTALGVLSDQPTTDLDIGTYRPALVIAPGTRIEPVAEDWVVARAADGSLALRHVLREQAFRNPASLTFEVTGSNDSETDISSGALTSVLESRADLIMGAGSQVVTDPGASMTFRGNTYSTLTLLGSVQAPGGTITVQGPNAYPFAGGFTPGFARSTVYLGAETKLDAAGGILRWQDAYGRMTGSLFNGGTIRVAGNVVALKGSVLDVSGTSAAFDFAPDRLGETISPLQRSLSALVGGMPSTLRSTSVPLDSDGGTIDLAGGQMLFLASDLRGFAGGPTARGGTLQVSSGRFYAPGTSRSSDDINLIVTQSGDVLDNVYQAASAGFAVFGASGEMMEGIGHFTVDQFAAGGFDSLDLGFNAPSGNPPIGGNVEFRGPIEINAKSRLRVAGGGVIYADSMVNLKSAYLAFGLPFLQPGEAMSSYPGRIEPDGTSVSNYRFSPFGGPGSLYAEADLIDVGTLTLKNIGNTVLNARGGDIRGNGVLSVAGNLTLSAGQVYPTTLSTFSIFAYDVPGSPSTVTITGPGFIPVPPISVGGSLNIFASNIIQGGTLRAPLGSIILGWDGTDFDPSDSDFDQPNNPITQAPNPVTVATATAPRTQTVVLQSGSVTSVAMNNLGGLDVPIPFGMSPDGVSWIDPRGVNVTTSGLASKRVAIAGESVVTQSGSVIDLQGGGELYAYRWKSGNGGSVDILGTASADWTAGKEYQPGNLVNYGGQTWSARVRHTDHSPAVSAYWTLVPESFAIIPGYQSAFAPYAPYNLSTTASEKELRGDPGLVSDSLRIGDQIMLQDRPGLSAGTYTLLPRRYAQLPGAFLITPTAGAGVGTIMLPEGGAYVSGTRYNTFDGGQKITPLSTRFRVETALEVRNRVSYEEFLSSSFFGLAAQQFNLTTVQRLPFDAGYLGLHGNTTLRPDGLVFAAPARGGRGAWADLSSFADMYVVGAGSTAPAGATAVINAGVVNSWGIESLLIGGLRRQTATETILEPRTGKLIVNNPGEALFGPDITLASRGELSLMPGSIVTSTGGLTESAPTYKVSWIRVDANPALTAATGDGAIVRVSGDRYASFTRDRETASQSSLLTIGAGSTLSGASVALDSTYGTVIDPSINIVATALTLGSGQISIILDPQYSGGLTGQTVSSQLVLEGAFLDAVQNVSSLTLRSYRTIDLYGAGVFGDSNLDELNLLASGLRGYGVGGSEAVIRAGQARLSNPSKLAATADPVVTDGTLRFETTRLLLGQDTFRVGGYNLVQLQASDAVVGTGEGGISVGRDLTITTPLITGLAGTKSTIKAGGSLLMESMGGASQTEAGLGASLTFTGADIVANTSIVLPSGLISLNATNGDVTVGGNLDVSGTRREFYDVIRYTGGGDISIRSDQGNVTFTGTSRISVSAPDGGADAGYVIIVSPQGEFEVQTGAQLLGTANKNYRAGSFGLDTKELPSFSFLSGILQNGGFIEEINVRVRTGNVLVDNPQNGVNVARKFTLSTDAGDIRVTGTIDASSDATGDETGGKIVLVSAGNLIIDDGAVLNVRAHDYSSAGKGGEIRLEAGAAINGTPNLNALLDLREGALIDLGVDASANYVAGNYATVGSAEFFGKFSGTLHLRAPRTATNDGIRVAAIGSEIRDAASILVEGFEVIQPTGGLITGWRATPESMPAANTTQGAVYASANAFLSTANYNAMMAQLLGADTQGLTSRLVLAPGVEIINLNGNLTLGRDNSTALGSAASNSADWDLSDFRFGPKGAAGVLTLRASGDVVFLNALSDGFRQDVAGTPNGLFLPPGTLPGQALWLSPLMKVNDALPTNLQSWSYRIAAGSDLRAADFRAVLPVNNEATDGSVRVGKFYTSTGVSGSTGTTAAAINNRYQVIRTGTGDIDIASRGGVQLRNYFSTIYTAGVRLPNPESIYGANDFSLPNLANDASQHPSQNIGGSNLGAAQQKYAAQWSMGGGNVNIAAQGNIERVTRVSATDATVIADDSHQLPSNWLYRRGYVDPSTGVFGVGGVNSGAPFIVDPSASTAWWIDFSNFFQGVGALGGGDVTLTAGRDIINVDAVTPTNARMPGMSPTGNLAPDADSLLQLGGGDIAVRAGGDISGGIYYVERGSGELFAGGSILTNSAKGIFGNNSLPERQLPTTLFVGDAYFDVVARKDVLIGPVSNAFLLPQGVNNKYWYKTYFNTFSARSGASITSIGGSVTHRLAVTTTNTGSISGSILQVTANAVNAFAESKLSSTRPWLRLAERDQVPNFDTALSLNAPNLQSTAFQGDINLVGPLTLYPSPEGNLELVAAQGIIGLQSLGQPINGAKVWLSSIVNMSDADPLGAPRPESPLAYQEFVGLQSNQINNINPFIAFDRMFKETGVVNGVSEDVKRALHRTDLLHAGDANPVRLYAGAGDITGFSLFSPKVTRVLAGQDFTDMSLYIQNVNLEDISIVSAGRDIIPFNENTSLRATAMNLTARNVTSGTPKLTTAGTLTSAMAGDIQISGSGALEVLAGRNIDLGTGANFVDGTGVGIFSVGNRRNSNLPFDGAMIVALAGVMGPDGIGPAIGLSRSSLNTESLEFIEGMEDFQSSYLETLDLEFASLTEEQKAIVALEFLFEKLRQTGKEYATTQSWEAGFAAIEEIFGTESREGDILTRARDIRTASNGNIILGAPGGGVAMASDIFGNPLTPPGIVTEFGGAISILTQKDVDIGQARIFTLRGGDLTIWSSDGNIAAGTAPKTVVTAPPTRVLIDVNSADVQTDLGGLATGGGIGVLASVEGVEPGDVVLTAPNGEVDAGDAGIRATGNITVAAVRVLNADNIAAGGQTSGVPASAPPAAPNVAGLSAGSSASGAASAAAANVASQSRQNQAGEEMASNITVEVLGYGGDEDEEDEEKDDEEDDASGTQADASGSAVEAGQVAR